MLCFTLSIEERRDLDVIPDSEQENLMTISTKRDTAHYLIPYVTLLPCPLCVKQSHVGHALWIGCICITCLDR